MSDLQALRRWAIACGIIPRRPHNGRSIPEAQSALRLSNPHHTKAVVEISVHLDGREPIGPAQLEVPPQGSRSVSFNEFFQPESLTYDEPFFVLIQASIPIGIEPGDTPRQE